jgi:DNA-binding NtrC family response regulator
MTAMTGQSAEFLAVLRAAKIVAATDVSVLIQGESGTGKELLAQAIHADSPRKTKPFIAVNCGALPEPLLESELFGHRKGAFTGAVHDYLGKICAADGGTLFLDEIAELSLAAQVKLLRFLETGECQTLGQAHNTCVNVRLLAASHQNLAQLCQTGQFRRDLYYRLHVVPLLLPPLRERTGDIDLLLKQLTAQLSLRHRLPPPQYSTQAQAILRRYPWQGNVRELRNFCERMVILAAGKTIEIEDLPPEMRGLPQTAAWQLPDAGLRLDELESNLIRQALVKSDGNRSKAARLLGLSRDTLLYRLKKHLICV